ncbi:MAG: family 2 glycosyl transferase [Bacteroidetes bacterium GWA2_32_17]|nr:MAG: family 2 glycosyl transferase [Bacteroidetes bacterium GWA2_32_17]
MNLSVIIPAYNEEEVIKKTIISLFEILTQNNIPHEIFVINDNSTDSTEDILINLLNSIPTLRYETNKGHNGFGYAVRYGIERVSGDCVAIFMADLSDSPADLVLFYQKMKEGDFDCVFGTRWSKGGKVIDYPLLKKVINRIANFIIRICFKIKYDDTTNAFKLYKRKTLDGLKPFIAPHYNLTIELSLKAIIRGYSYAVLPNLWTNRKWGESKFKIKEMGSRYLFIMLYCLIEKYFSKNDFKKRT